MKQTYWVAKSKNDPSEYNVRKKTKKAVLETLKAYQESRKNEGYHWENDFEQPKKVTVYYEDGFDLLTQCLSGGRGIWEY